MGFLAGHAIAQPPSGATPKPELQTLAALQARIVDHISAPRFAAAAWGLKIVSLDTGKALFEHQAHKLLKPASVAKLYTGALALDRLGPEFRIRTSLYSATRPSKSGALAGDLMVYGRGDPSFAARFNEGDYAPSLEPLAQALAAAGVQRISGDLVGDETFFRGPPLGSGWMWEDLQCYYGAEVSALTVDDNVVDLTFSPGPRPGAPCSFTAGPATPFLQFINRTQTGPPGGARQIHLYRPIGENTVYLTGSLPLGDTNYVDAVTVHQPAMWFLARFKEALARRGITIGGRMRAVNWLDRESKAVEYSKLIELGHAESRPMKELVQRMMKSSQNLYAQLLLLQVGARSGWLTNDTLTTEAAGLAELDRFLGEAGVRKSEVLLEEGSGLSRGALVTPDSTLALLQYMHRHRHSAVFLDSLPTAGVDGSLRNRMKGTLATGKARAKPGSLRHVNTLSGYVTTAAGERLAFALMLNNYKVPEGGSPARTELDDLVVLLAGFKGRS